MTTTESGASRFLLIAAGPRGTRSTGLLRANGADIVVYTLPTGVGNSLARLADGRYAASPVGLLHDRNLIITWFDTEAAADRTFTDEFVAAIRPGTLIIDHTMAAAEGARQLARRITAVGATFLDAPVLWGNASATDGKISIMVGADDDDIFETAAAAVAPYVAKATHVGPVGAGRVCRMANQLCIAGALGGLAEGLGLAIAAGLSPDLVVEVLRMGGAQSQQLQGRAPLMIRRDFETGFAAYQMRDEISLALSEAERLSLRTPVSETIGRQFAMLLDRGFGDEDCSNLLRLVAD